MIQWINTGPVAANLPTQTTRIYNNIIFTASGYDIGGGGTPFKYQRYNSTNCSSPIANATGMYFITGADGRAGNYNFSYTIYDSQGLSGNCATTTGTRKLLTGQTINTGFDLQ